MEEWLPLSSRQQVRELRAYSNTPQPVLTRIPTGMLALEHVQLALDDTAAADWFPFTSRERVRVLIVSSRVLTRMRILEGLKALEKLKLEGMDLLDIDWLPASSAHLRQLHLCSCTLLPIPPGLSALQKLDMYSCNRSAVSGLRTGAHPTLSVPWTTAVAEFRR